MDRPELCNRCGRSKRYHDYSGGCGLFLYDGDDAALRRVPTAELRELSNLDMARWASLERGEVLRISNTAIALGMLSSRFRAALERIQLNQEAPWLCSQIVREALDVKMPEEPDYLEKAHAAGRAEALAEVRVIVEGIADKTYAESREYPTSHTQRQALHVASCRIRDLLDKLPKAGD